MLEKLASCANYLDEKGQFRLAAELTDVLEKYAMAEFGDFVDDESEDDTSLDYRPDYLSKRWHDSNEVDLRDDHFLGKFQSKNPRGFDDYMSALEQVKRPNGDPTERYFQDVKMTLPPGVASKLKTDQFGDMVYDRDFLDETNQVGSQRYKSFTEGVGGKARRGRFLADIGSTTGPRENESYEDFRKRILSPRDYTFDADIIQKYLDETGRNVSGLPVIDTQQFHSLVNPAHKDYDTEDKIFDNKYSPNDIRTKRQEEEKGLGWLAGHAIKMPKRVFDLQRFPRPTNEQTGRKEPNWYYRSKPGE